MTNELRDFEEQAEDLSIRKFKSPILHQHTTTPPSILLARECSRACQLAQMLVAQKPLIGEGDRYFVLIVKHSHAI
jgi:hypothetical protein